ncbi:MAG: hypothetical protein Q4B71_07630, partial [Cardiobacteriaceae bacterium]|nr:hypothetical protein [Cardiobacteriaceae bacterium]
MENKFPNRLAWLISAILHGGFAVALAHMKTPVSQEMLPEYQPFDLEMLAPPAPLVAPAIVPVAEAPLPEPE